MSSEQDKKENSGMVGKVKYGLHATTLLFPILLLLISQLDLLKKKLIDYAMVVSFILILIMRKYSLLEKLTVYVEHRHY